MWNFRRPVLSIRWRRRAVIHFWTVKVVGEVKDMVVVAVVDVDLMPTAHFRMRQPEVARS